MKNTEINKDFTNFDFKSVESAFADALRKQYIAFGS